MIRVYLLLIFSCTFVWAEPLPKIEFSMKKFAKVEVWQQYLGDMSYISYIHDTNSEAKIYNYSANIPSKQLPAIFNDNRTSFNGSFSSFCSANNIRFLEALLAKGYHLIAYVYEQDIATEYTIVGYNRNKEEFTVRLKNSEEKYISYKDINIQYAAVKSDHVRKWNITSLDKDGKIIFKKQREASSITQVLQDIGNNKEHIIFIQLATESPIKISGWSGENQFDQMIQFGGSNYNTLDERVVTIYISQQSATGCHMTRYTTGAKGDGYSENVVSGNVYCFSTNPVAINKAAGLARFVLRCKVRKNSPTSWWVKAQIYYRLFTPDSK